MNIKKFVVLFEHPHYPEIYLFDTMIEANEKYEELLEENNREDGHCDGYLFVGNLDGFFQKIKTYY